MSYADKQLRIALDVNTICFSGVEEEKKKNLHVGCNLALRM